MSFTHLLCCCNCLASDGIGVRVLGSVLQQFVNMAGDRAASRALELTHTQASRGHLWRFCIGRAGWATGSCTAGQNSAGSISSSPVGWETSALFVTTEHGHLVLEPGPDVSTLAASSASSKIVMFFVSTRLRSRELCKFR